MKERLALDIALWQNKPQEAIVEDLASAAIEQRADSFEHRINPFTLSFNEFASLQTGLSRETESDRAENEAYFRILNWAKDNEQGYMLWISPASVQYSESRFVVYELSNNSKTQTLNCWAICGNETGQDCADIARQISPDFPTNQELVRNPLPFTPGKLKWTTFLSEFFGQSEVWRAIDNGNARREKERMKLIARKIAEKETAVIYQNMTREGTIAVGAMVEKEMESKGGISFQTKGSCGVSNQSLVGKSSPVGILTRMADKIETKRGRFVVKCPYCKTKIQRVMYPGERCPNYQCGKVYTGNCK